MSALAGDGGFAVEWDFVGGERHGDLVLATGFGWIRASGSLSRFDGARYRMTGVLRQSAERWRWRVYHASEPGTWS